MSRHSAAAAAGHAHDVSVLRLLGQVESGFMAFITRRLAERFMAHDPQRQSPVLSQVVEVSEAHVASLPMHARRKLSRLAIQVALACPLKLSHKSAVLTHPADDFMR